MTSVYANFAVASNSHFTDINQEDTVMKKDVKFTEAMNKLYSLVYQGWGSEHPVLEDIAAWFSDDANDIITDELIEFAYRFNEKGMFYLLRDLMNWDFLWVTEDGRIDIENANEPEIAKLISPYVQPELALKVRATF